MTTLIALMALEAVIEGVLVGVVLNEIINFIGEGAE